MNNELNDFFEIKKEKTESVIINKNNNLRHFLSRFLVLATIIIGSLILLESNIMRVQSGHGVLLLSIFFQFFWFLFVIIELFKFQIKKKYSLRSTNFKLLLAAICLYLIIIEIGVLINN